jgi:hypothetical protein
MSKMLCLSYALIIAAGAIWGGVFSLVLLAASEGAHPLGISVWQVVITALRPLYRARYRWYLLS